MTYAKKRPAAPARPAPRLAHCGADALAALSDPTRRAVFEKLRHGPQPVSALARGMPVSRPAVSQHLKILKDAHLVSEQRDGTRRLYRIEASGLEALRRWFDMFWDDALARFAAHAEAPPKREKAVAMKGKDRG
ncbi:MAG TPA: metalloregulator ArsR/SmtB family transcription factor [Micropepsaceae bacterium]|nr:metalloregulator ArsR/SmtB family transcription factor [Micropepsaceae bacterium]